MAQVVLSLALSATWWNPWEGVLMSITFNLNPYLWVEQAAGCRVYFLDSDGQQNSRWYGWRGSWSIEGALVTIRFRQWRYVVPITHFQLRTTFWWWSREQLDDDSEFIFVEPEPEFWWWEILADILGHNIVDAPEAIEIVRVPNRFFQIVARDRRLFL